MPRPARPMSPTSPGSAPPHAQAPRLASQRGRPRDRRGFLMYGDPRSPSPPPSPCEPAGPPCICQGPGPGRRAGRTRRRARPLPNARRAMFRPTTAKAATRPIRRASLPAVPRPSGLPPAGREEPAPRGGLGARAQRADASSYMPYFAAAWRRATLALMHGTTPTARTPTIAVTQAAKSPKCRAGIPMSRPTT